MAAHSSSYNVKLGPWFLLRAQGIFIALLLLILGTASAGIYLGVKDGSLPKKINGIKQAFSTTLGDLMAESTKSANVNYGQNINIIVNNDSENSPSPVASATPVATKKATTQKPYVAPQPTCTYYNIREGQFASNKCYTAKDYDDLIYYLNRYDSVAFDRQGAANQSSVTCSGFSDNFKQQCEKNKAQIAQDDQDLAKYAGIINGIIARGK